MTDETATKVRGRKARDENDQGTEGVQDAQGAENGQENGETQTRKRKYTRPEVPQYNTDDEITVMRGLDKGRTAKIVAVDKTNQQYVIQFPDGAFAVINFVNVKPPQEGTVTVTTLTEVFNEALAAGERDILQVAARLDAKLPGFSDKLPASSGETGQPA